MAFFVLLLCPFDISVGIGAFVIGLGQISSFLSLYLHLFPAAVWSVVTRFPASGCLKCHYSSHSSSDLVVWLIPLYYGIFSPRLPEPNMATNLLTSVLDFHSKNLQITSKLLTQGYRYHKLRKTFGKFFRSYSELLSKGVYMVYILNRPLFSAI